MIHDNENSSRYKKKTVRVKDIVCIYKSITRDKDKDKDNKQSTIIDNIRVGLQVR